jgi:large subunit ribosomal protein L29
MGVRRAFQIFRQTFSPAECGIKFSNFQISIMSKTIDFKKSIQNLNEQDLQAKINEDEQRLKKLEFAHAISPLENPMSIRNLRREVARLKTELKKKKQLG